MTPSAFHEQYIRVRDKEGRVYPDETVKVLPEIPANHRHYAEWMVRKRSSRRLIRYLKAQKRPLHILEIGCGNGWLTHRLAAIPGAVVVGQDINLTELRQAVRVFGEIANIRFTSQDLSEFKPEKDIDIIVFAASIQYFPSLRYVLQWSLERLTKNGEIHILDSPFYAPQELKEAIYRTITYFTALGVPEMAQFIFHKEHLALTSFHPKLLYDPHSTIARLLHRKDPFPWYCIKASPVSNPAFN